MERYVLVTIHHQTFDVQEVEGAFQFCNKTSWKFEKKTILLLGNPDITTDKTPGIQPVAKSTSADWVGFKIIKLIIITKNKIVY